MAVEAHHLHQSSSRLLPARHIVGPAMNLYNAHVNAFNSDAPLLPAPYNPSILHSLPHSTPIQSDTPVSRKRSRDSITYAAPLLSYVSTTAGNDSTTCAAFSFLDRDISLQILSQQLDFDRLTAHHIENVRVDLEEKRKRQARRILEAVEVGMRKRLSAKEEEIAKIGKLNWALEEKVKSLCLENQIWRDLAQTNEATANALRTNLEQVLAHFKDERRFDDGDGATVLPAGADLTDDAQSCCGSTGIGVDVEVLRDVDGGNDGKDIEGWRRLGGGGWQDEEEEGGETGEGKGKGSTRGRLCRKCGKEESCVLMLPCRHLCLCTVCGSSLNTCPICKSFKTGSFHVNLS